MSSLPLGFILFCATLLFATPFSAWSSYLNEHSIIIVIGGTFSILFLSTPVRILKSLLRSLVALTHKDMTLSDHAREIEELSETRRLTTPSANPFLNYAVELWDNGTSPEMFQVLISQRREQLDGQATEAVQAMRNLAKYPPAMGMTGTVMGLVTLFVNLSTDNKGSLGPALGLAMTATFFGLLLANGIIMPLADRLHVAHLGHRAYMQSIYELLLMINRREPSALIRGEVKERAAAAA